ncbi:cysteine hydrolase [Oceanicola sp. D3]|uniref:cysteine hydrolase family protein n=1 Tax=Oceanicola sp. D3 TaxID=2587163 RepID=UPI0011220350|nr:isochorismatase family cysteine hydrolase [Oceanicola sp. D3]QDC08122.1 cysteine hydrolase [Oceanicola sp. D3]
MTTINPKKSAVILVDMARDFVEEGGFIADAGGADYRARAAAIVPRLKAVVEAARKAGVTVIFSTDAHTPEDIELRKWPPHSMAGTKWAEILPELGPEAGDLVLPKTTYSGFLSSDLEAQLQAHGIDTIYMTGLHTDCCCRHTSGDAFQRGYDLVWITDALEAFTPEAHEGGLEYYRTYYAIDEARQFRTAQEVVADWEMATEAA